MQQHAPIQTLDARAADILERVKGVFAAKGFDGASMQDLARAAGMSAGNFYRYFPSKASIVEAMVARDLRRIEADFAAIMQAPSPRAALRETIRRRLTEDAAEHDVLWAEIEAAAARRPEIAAIHARTIGAIRSCILRVFSVIAGSRAADAETRFGAEVDVLMLLVRGAAMEGCGRSAGRNAAAIEKLHAHVLRHVDLILASVAGDATFPLATNE